ncbi:MAG: sulfatase [Provencibacterium sp.]|jgi:N-sulfoglucosamine sulfohydrolase|nr:sulfatase [Provencibacterium sp.]
MKQPNILFITCHDLGDYLGCYGTPVETPCIDSIAQHGVQLCNHFSTATICSPARGAILTGCYQHTNGLMGLVHRGWNLDVEHCPTLPATLAQNGWQTALFGFQHEHMQPKELGYQEIHAGKDAHCENVVPLFEEWLAGRGGSDKPFYAAMGFSEVHRMGMNPSHFRMEGYPYADPAEVEVRPYLPDIPETRQDLSEFYGAIRYMDHWVGRALQALERAGLRENTLVIFTTDHGASFMHSKATLYDGGTRVAFLASLPGRLPEGLRVQAITSHVDILPTMLAQLGVPAPEGVQGRDVSAILSGSASGRDYAFSEENYNNHFVPGRAVRSERYRYIKNGLQINIFDFLIPEIELSTSDFRKNRKVFDFYSAERVLEELYDHQSDPGELHNLAADPAYSEILAEHQAALARHMEKTNDPFAQFQNGLLMPQNAYTRLRELRPYR